jgi:hypothetical protein
VRDDLVPGAEVGDSSVEQDDRRTIALIDDVETAAGNGDVGSGHLYRT